MRDMLSEFFGTVSEQCQRAFAMIRQVPSRVPLFPMWSAAALGVCVAQAVSCLSVVCMAHLASAFPAAGLPSLCGAQGDAHAD